MTAEIGHYALILSLIISALGAVFSLAGAALDIRGWMRVSQAAAMSLAITVTVAIGSLAYAFITSDFTLLNVARHSNTALPWYYKAAAVWGSHEGSILFWVTTLCWWTFAVAVSARHLPEKVLARILGTLQIIAFGLFLFILMTSNPFLRLFPGAEEGADLNPLLQDPGMIFHPPLLYLGYVGFAVPFAFAVAALLGGRLDVSWARWMRPWTIASWVLLTLGIALGSYWSYYELGWGGWWAWDPVENSSLMPWLTGTALMHSLIVTHKRGFFKIWTVFLAILTFSLSLLGTFLVRSGVLTSVHAFATDPERGIFILIFLILVIGCSFLLFAWRGSSVRQVGEFATLSRENGILWNNAILLIAMGSILLGTLYPLFLDAWNGSKISVGAPYFDLVFGWIAVPLAFLLPLGVFAGWKQYDSARLIKESLPALIIATFGAIAIPFAMGEFHYAASIASFLALWITVGALTQIVQWARAQRRYRQPMSWWGMHIAHIGVAMIIFGSAMVTIYQVERNVTMYPGDIVTVRDATFRYNGWHETRGPNYQAAIGSITVFDKQNQEVVTLHPEKRNYDSVSNMTMTEASIQHYFHEDLYVSMGSPTPDGKGWVMRAYVKPFVLWIWIGSLLLALGGICCLRDRPQTKATYTGK